MEVILHAFKCPHNCHEMVDEYRHICATKFRNILHVVLLNSCRDLFL